jgi:uncharacterized protein
MNKTILITGASGGIGREFARLAAKDYPNMLLIARREEELQAVKKELETYTNVYILPLDLSLEESINTIISFTKEHNLFIHTIINNAGFGDFAEFKNAEWEKLGNMITVNIRALTHLSHVFINHMVRAGEGHILNVASTAAFLPGPLMAVYFATKAYVLSLSQALSEELKGSGVYITTLCPGPTASGFQAVSAMGKSRMIKGKKMPTAHEVALFGYQSMQQHKSVAVHGLGNVLMTTFSKFLPGNIAAGIVKNLQKE